MDSMGSNSALAPSRADFVQRMLEVRVEGLEDLKSKCGSRTSLCSDDGTDPRPLSMDDEDDTLKLIQLEQRKRQIQLTLERANLGLRKFMEAQSCQALAHGDIMTSSASKIEVQPRRTKSTPLPTLDATQPTTSSATCLSSVTSSNSSSSLRSLTSSNILQERIDNMRKLLDSEDLSTADRKDVWLRLSRMEAAQARREKVMKRQYSRMTSAIEQGEYMEL